MDNQKGCGMTNDELIEMAKAAGMEGEPSENVLKFFRNLMANERLECLRILSDKSLSRFGVIEQIKARGQE